MFHHINPTAPIYIHRNALRVSYGTEGGPLGSGGVLDKEPCGIAWSDKELKELADQLLYDMGRPEVAGEIFFSWKDVSQPDNTSMKKAVRSLIEGQWKGTAPFPR